MTFYKEPNRCQGRRENSDNFVAEKCRAIQNNVISGVPKKNGMTSGSTRRSEKARRPWERQKSFAAGGTTPCDSSPALPRTRVTDVEEARRQGSK